MKKMFVAFLALCLVACGPNQKERADLIEWGKEIGGLQKNLVSSIHTSDAFILDLSTRVPNREDCNQLKEFIEPTTAIYNAALDLTPPEEARLVHNKFVDSFARNADVSKYYALYICENEASYYDQYTLAVTEANRLSEEAFHDLKVLMEDNSISCSEIDLCK